MRRLTQKPDGGATMVSFIIMLMATFGVMGLGIDGSAIFAKRQQVQNGADAAAFAVAQEYALDGCAVASGDLGLATQYVQANVPNQVAEGAAAAVEIRCDGPADNELTVVAEGRQSPFFFSAVGVGPIDVPASASVEWGTPISGTSVLPLTMSICSYYDVFGGDPLIGETFNLDFITPSDSDEECPYHSDYPSGGFNWLDPTDGCAAFTTVGTWAPGDTGANVPPGCDAAYFSSLLNQTLLIPIFTDDQGVGSAGEYWIEGYAAIKFTGYWFNTLGGSPKGDGAACTGAAPKLCLTGTFQGYVGIDEDYVIVPPSPGDAVLIVRLID
jgi:hypothetical protein